MQNAALLPTTEFVDSLEISGTGVPKSKLHCISTQAFLDLASEIQDHDLGPSMYFIRMTEGRNKTYSKYHQQKHFSYKAILAISKYNY